MDSDSSSGGGELRTDQFGNLLEDSVAIVEDSVAIRTRSHDVALCGEPGPAGAPLSSEDGGDRGNLVDDWSSRQLFVVQPDGTRMAMLERWSNSDTVSVARKAELVQLFSAVSGLGRDLYAVVGPGLEALGARTEWLRQQHAAFSSALSGMAADNSDWRRNLGGACDSFEERLGALAARNEQLSAQVASVLPSHTAMGASLDLLKANQEVIGGAVRGHGEQLSLILARLEAVESNFGAVLERNHAVAMFEERLSRLESAPPPPACVPEPPPVFSSPVPLSSADFYLPPPPAPSRTNLFLL